MANNLTGHGTDSGKNMDQLKRDRAQLLWAIALLVGLFVFFGFIAMFSEPASSEYPGMFLP